MIKADFLVTGVMKGGTTILYDFITSHPEVNKATQKEIHYFSLNYEKGDKWYSDYFSENGNLNGEASPTYFDLATSRTIPTMINRHNPNAKIIVILREPVERAISHYNHLVKVNDNQKLQELGVERFFNLPYTEAITSSNEVSSLLFQVLNFSAYAQKLAIYRKEFGERLLVLKNEQLRSDPYSTMKLVFQFLGVAEDYVHEDFDKVKYSSGTTLQQVSAETQRKLSDFFASDVAAITAASNRLTNL
jgi:hypothetical protein